MTEKKTINQYEAAAITGLSPELLAWLTTHAPKQGIKRKLKYVKIKDAIYFYDKEELTEFNNWLKLPWPHEKGKRPHLPSAIRREIKYEANGECAICHGHKDSCEAAHLDPVSKSKNNHPENLLWLCSTHHTVYDKGLFGPDKENAKFVAGLKIALHRHKVMLWRMQHEVSHKLFIVLENCNGLSEQLAAATTPTQIKAVESIAKATLSVVPALSPVSKTDPKYAAYKSISDDVLALSKSKASVSVRLQKTKKIRQEYVAAYGFVACPLCEGTGRHGETDCPVCNGDREIEKRFADRVDLTAYEQVDCPVCEGEGLYYGDRCPACGGEARMDRRYADAIDVRDYAKVECPLCKGTSKYEGADCPACGGNGEMDRRHEAQLDVKEFKNVKCPLCEGGGQYDGRNCPECGGEGEMPRRSADKVDLRDYKKVDCPVCDAEGRLHGNDCPVCGGEARIDKRHLDSIDTRDYRLVDCPVCQGKGQRRDIGCRACGGEGQMERRHADNIDPGDYP
jgi:DnaJ-class molecular chaperone